MMVALRLGVYSDLYYTFVIEVVQTNDTYEGPFIFVVHSAYGSTVDSSTSHCFGVPRTPYCGNRPVQRMLSSRDFQI